MVAPTTTIETVTIVRPLKVMACVCGVLAIILLIIAMASTAWLSAAGYRQGLWEECHWQDKEPIKCNTNPDKAWIKACAAMTIICMIITIIGTIIIAVGLFTKNPDRKFMFYKIAMFFMFFAVVFIVIALIVFPVMFMKEIGTRGGKDYWEFDWAYGVAWGGAIFCFGSGILLLIDKESEEIFYREKTYYGEADA